MEATDAGDLDLNGWDYIALAALILLLLPAVVMPWEGRRAPDALYAAIAIAGLIAAGLRDGPGAVAWAVVGALTALAIIAAVATAIRIRRGVRIVTAGHVKLMAAGSLWLGPVGAMAMVAGAFALLFLAALFQRRLTCPRRPDFMAIAAIAILCTGIQQSLPETAESAAPISKTHP
jgi:prepilin signal peptidase PulO-like enzyme (type II secretory pathway)